jgi:hypothetical protein
LLTGSVLEMRFSLWPLFVRHNELQSKLPGFWEASLVPKPLPQWVIVHPFNGYQCCVT